jgi:hypothetical protein
MKNMKSILLQLVVMMLLVTLSSSLQAQQQTDSLYANNVRVYVQEDSTTTPVIGAHVELNSQNMGMSFVPKHYSALTNNQGFSLFPNILVGIDTTVSVPHFQQVETKIYSQGSTLHIELPHNTQGRIELYSIDGKKHHAQQDKKEVFTLQTEHLSSGVYLLRGEFADAQSIQGKVFIENGMVRGLSSNLQTNSLQETTHSAKLHNLFFADYELILSKDGYYPDTSIITLGQGNNPDFIKTLQKIPPPTVSVHYTVRDMDRNPLENVLVLLKDTASGHIDTLRTNSQGQAEFTGLAQGLYFYQAIGGKPGYKSWDGTPLQAGSPWPNIFILHTPNATTDTLLERQFVLISDTLEAPANNNKVAVSDYMIAEMFNCFNIHLSLHDTAYSHFKMNTWYNDTAIFNQFMGMQQTLSQNAGIPIVDIDTPFNIPALWKPPNAMLYNPFTTPPRMVGTNFVNGNNTTYIKYYGFDNLPTSPFYGDLTIMSCDSITISGAANAFVKEHFRWWGASDVSSRPSVMNSTATTPSDVDFALMNMYYQLGQNRYKHEVHDLNNMLHLRDSIMILTVPWAQKVTGVGTEPTDQVTPPDEVQSRPEGVIHSRETDP